jgi:hypothetical protein
MNASEAIQRLRGVICRQQKDLATEESYVHWLRHYIGSLREIPTTALTSEQKLERFAHACSQGMAAMERIPEYIGTHMSFTDDPTAPGSSAGSPRN